MIKRIVYISCAMALLSVVACTKEVKVAAPDNSKAVEALLAADSANVYDHPLDTVFDDGCTPLRSKHIPLYRKAFGDKNPVHIRAARAIGIKPIHTDEDIWKLDRRLVRINSCAEYYLDDLTHSFPYLVPEAAQLLSDIGRTFNDSLSARGGGAYRIKVTSVLRTPATVKRLRRVNRNATGESTHSYGTTIDISYSKFVVDSICEPRRTFADLKGLLAEVLYDLKAQGRCYVKYEVKQSCFHITARPSTDL